MENQVYSVCALSTMHHQFGSRDQFADVGPIKAASRYDGAISVFSCGIFLLQTSRNYDSSSPFAVIMMVAVEEMINQVNQTSWTTWQERMKFSHWMD